MNRDNRHDIERWVTPERDAHQCDPDYPEWLASEIEAGVRELDAGHGVPAAEAWKSLGLG